MEKLIYMNIRTSRRFKSNGGLEINIRNKNKNTTAKTEQQTTSGEEERFPKSVK